VTELKVLIDRRLQYSVSGGLGLAAMTSQDIKDRRFEVAELLIAGRDPTEVSKTYEVSKDTLFDWVLSYIQAYYPPVDRVPDFDEGGEYLDSLYEEAAAATLQRARKQEGGAKRSRQKKNEAKGAEQWHRSLVDNQLGKNLDALKDPHLAALIEGDDKYRHLPDRSQRSASWIQNYVKTLWRFEQLIDEERERNPEALKDPELVQRLSQKAQKFPKKQRRDRDWIEAYLEAPRLCQRFIDEELEQNPSVLVEPDLPVRLFDKVVSKLSDENRREVGWFQAYVKKLRRKLATAEH
jgi:hypothetical protein